MDVSEEANSSDPVAEVQAMAKLADAVKGLDPEAIGRVLRWAVDRYGVSTKSGSHTVSRDSLGGGSRTESSNSDSSGGIRFESFAELYDAAAPDTEADKVLVGGYWLQFGTGEADFAAQEVNTAL